MLSLSLRLVLASFVPMKRAWTRHRPIEGGVQPATAVPSLRTSASRKP